MCLSPLQNNTTLRMDSPACIRSKALLMSASGIVWVMRSSMLILRSMYPVDDLRDVAAASRTAEGGAFPVAPGDELEGAGADLLAGAGDADDHGGAPAAV